MRRLALSWWEKIEYSLLAIPVKLFVKSKPIPIHPVEELPVDVTQPILYVLPYKSKVDVSVVRQLTKQFHLPDPVSGIIINGRVYRSFMFIDNQLGKRLSGRQKQKTVNLLRDLLIEQRKNPQVEIQMVPVTVLFNRKPGKEGKRKISFQVLGSVSKFFHMLFSGYDCYTRFSRPVLLNNLISNDTNDIQLAHKLVRVARIHFARQRLATIGPKLPNHRIMLNQLLNSIALTEAICEEARSKNIPIGKARKNALKMLNEISAKFTYWAVRVTDFLLTWAWSQLYQGIKIHNADPVRQLAQKGHEIVYVPCHRSHMDYLLLSYVLYRQGLVPPHIAAGINLNFWPAGPIFRRLGAFFIRRSFRGNKLYTAVFREYLAQLFIRGYSVEYFIEGGRSRTGRLLDPKTGMLMMTIQTMLRGDPRPITFVPVYIGYEHVLEVATYADELYGAKKQKESLWQTMKACSKLKKLGYGFVNFGEPIPLNHFLNHHIPEWRESIDPVEPQRPNWLTPTTNQLAVDIMQNINCAAAVNAMNLCCTILLSRANDVFSKTEFIEQMNYLLTLLRQVPYDTLVTVPSQTACGLFEHAREMGKFIITDNGHDELIRLSSTQAVLMTYYRNNIAHLLIIPGFIARIVINRYAISPDELTVQIMCFYPFIRAEFFLHQDDAQLQTYIEDLIHQLIRLGLVKEDQNRLYAVSSKITYLASLAASADSSLQRYAIALTLLEKNPNQNRANLERISRSIAEKVSKKIGLNAPEFWDKSVFSTLINTFREQGLLNDKEPGVIEKIENLTALITPLITPETREIIENALSVIQCNPEYHR